MRAYFTSIPRKGRVWVLPRRRFCCMLSKSESLFCASFLIYPLFVSTLVSMSNLDLWYCAGIVVLGASFSYIVLSAVQFMGMNKKDEKSPSAGSDHTPPTQFLRHALLAFAGIMLGAQLLQYHQDQQEMAKKDIGRDMALARVLTPKAAAPGAAGVVSPNPAGLGERPTSRPPRGYFSVAEAEKAAAEKAAAATSTPALAVVPVVPVTPIAASVTPAK